MQQLQAAVSNQRLWRHPPALSVAAVTVALAMACGIPALQHLTASRLYNKTPIDYRTCDGCGCWDTISIGPRETPGHTGYHHLYWNTNGYTLIIFSITALHIILCHKAAEWLVRSLLVDGVRVVFLALALANVFPNYYSWWCYVMYFNERVPMLKLARHHLYYYVSELVVTGLTVNMASANSEVTPGKVACVFTICCSHLFGGIVDQYVLDTRPPSVGAYAAFHSRNAALISSDLLHTVACCYVYATGLRQSRELTRSAACRLLAAVLLCCIATQLL